MEGTKRGVLFFVTSQRLVAVDMAELKWMELPEQLQYDTTFPIPTLESPLMVIDFMEKGLPVGMSPFVRQSESRLYLFGGEKPVEKKSQDIRPYYQGALLDRSFGYKGICSDVYVCDLTNLHSGIQFTHHSTMICPKTHPVVAEIQGKIYVLSGFPFHYHCDLPSPTFEMYDPSVGKWEALPNPPYYRQHDDIVSYLSDFSHAVRGNTLFVHTYFNLYSYSVDEGEWKCVRIREPRILPANSRPNPLPANSCDSLFLPPCVAKFVPGYPDVFISLHQGHLYAGLVSCDGGPDRHQFIYDMTDGCERLCLDEMSSLVVPLGEGEMCAMVNGMIPTVSDVSFGVYMITFRIEKLEESPGPAPKPAKTDPASKPAHGQDTDDSDSPFLSITILTRGFYDFDVWGYDQPIFTGAFFLPWSEISSEKDGWSF